MVMTQAIELLDSNKGRNIASRQALIDACNKIATGIINGVPFEAESGCRVDLPRKYAVVTQTFDYEMRGKLKVRYLAYHGNAYGSIQGLLAINCGLVTNDPDLLAYHKSLKCKPGADLVDVAERKVLLAFAKDVAGGMIEEIAAFVAADTEQNEQCLALLAAA